jgi:hypothetical protein
VGSCEPGPLVNRHFLKRLGGRRKTWRRHLELLQPRKMFCPVSVYKGSETMKTAPELVETKRTIGKIVIAT